MGELFEMKQIFQLSLTSRPVLPPELDRGKGAPSAVDAARRAFSGSADEPVADAVHGLQMLGIRGVGLEDLAQSQDEVVDRAGGR